MKYRGHRIRSVDPDSIADQMGLEAGDRLLTIDGRELQDIFDYQFMINSEFVVLEVLKANGEEWELDIDNNYEDLGINFENGLMSDYRSCRNKCIFCFIDQMPPGMRETLYFKDDDSRLSFLQGNYVTLTNMSDADVDRIIRFKLSPINISVHTTNPELRCRMLNNRFAGKSLEIIDRLWRAETPMNGQVVLCPGINDGAELDRTIGDLAKYVPYMESLSVVPVGITKYRDGLFPMKSFDRESAAAAVDLIEGWQKRIYAEHGIHFVHASDEFYIMSGRPLPEEGRYDGYLQLENGVGMLRLLTEEVADALEAVTGDDGAEEISLATGVLAYDYMKRFVGQFCEKFPNRNIHVYCIENRFFGEKITVAGLITGQDLECQLKGKPLGSRLLLPEVMFRSGEEVFLDDMTREDLQNALQVPVNIVKSSGYDLIEAFRRPVEGDSDYSAYELKEIEYD